MMFKESSAATVSRRRQDKRHLRAIFITDSPRMSAAERYLLTAGRDSHEAAEICASTARSQCTEWVLVQRKSLSRNV